MRPRTDDAAPLTWAGTAACLHYDYSDDESGDGHRGLRCLTGVESETLDLVLEEDETVWSKPEGGCKVDPGEAGGLPQAPSVSVRSGRTHGRGPVARRM